MQVLDATTALQSRVEEAERLHQVARTTASGAEKMASNCTSKVEDLQKLVQALVGGIWGWDTDLGRAAHSTKPLHDLVAELSTTVRNSCTEDMLNAVKTLTTQVSSLYILVLLSTCQDDLIHSPRWMNELLQFIVEAAKQPFLCIVTRPCLTNVATLKSKELAAYHFRVLLQAGIACVSTMSLASCDRDTSPTTVTQQ